MYCTSLIRILFEYFCSTLTITAKSGKRKDRQRQTSSLLVVIIIFTKCSRFHPRFLLSIVAPWVALQLKATEIRSCGTNETVCVAQS